jgi:hypothetical protein
MTTGSGALETGVGLKGDVLGREGANFQPNQYTLPYYVNTRKGQASKTDLGCIYFVGELAIAVRLPWRLVRNYHVCEKQPLRVPWNEERRSKYLIATKPYE